MGLFWSRRDFILGLLFEKQETLSFKLTNNIYIYIPLPTIFIFSFVFLLIGGYFELFSVESEVCNEVFKKLFLWMQSSYKHNAAVLLL